MQKVILSEKNGTLFKAEKFVRDGIWLTTKIGAAKNLDSEVINWKLDAGCQMPDKCRKIEDFPIIFSDFLPLK